MRYKREFWLIIGTMYLAIILSIAFGILINL